MFASRLRTRVFSVLFSFVNWILSGSWSRHKVIFSKLLSEPAWSLQVDLHWASPHLPWIQRICRHLFFRVYSFLSRDFVNQHAFCSSIYIETALNSREECIEFADLLFWRLSLCLLRDSLSRDTRSLDLCILFKFIFLYLWYIPPYSCAFDAFYLTPIFSYVYYHAKYFSYPWWHCCSKFNHYFWFQQSKASFELYFSFYVSSFDTMEFSMKQVLTCSYSPTKLQAMLLLFYKSESLESYCFKVGCHPFLQRNPF